MPETFLGITAPWRHDGEELRDGNVVGLRIGRDGRILVHAATEERLSGRRYDPLVGRSVGRVLERIGFGAGERLHVAISSALGPRLSENEARTLVRRSIGMDATTVMVISHHDAHALESFAPSGYDEAIVIVTDSAGNLIGQVGEVELWEHHTIYHGVRRPDGRCELELLAREFVPGFGYGQLFRAVTRYVGFPGYHHASKVMAMAGIAYEHVVPLRSPHEASGDGSTRMGWCLDGADPVPSLCAWFDAIGFDHLGPRSSDWYCGGSHEDNGRSSLRETDLLVAAWVQRGWEECLLGRIAGLIADTGIRRVCLGGGVALNCVANARVGELPGVDAVHVGSAPGDHGQGLGNLVALLGTYAPELVSTAANPPYFGAVSEEPSSSPSEAAERLTRGQILAVCRGVAEYGPRALGHRSLLAVPTRSVMKRMRAVKRREDYQPFAVCVTDEYATTHLRGLRSPYMSFAPRVEGDAADDLADVLHDDGSCRIQTVSATDDPWLHQLLSLLPSAGRPPALVNTSLNLRSEPMVDYAMDSRDLAERFGVDGAIVDARIGSGR